MKRNLLIVVYVIVFIVFAALLVHVGKNPTILPDNPFYFTDLP
ncbi:MAG: hypothetical protein WC878_06185 [Candidatus Paceibacterota bacterium]